MFDDFRPRHEAGGLRRRQRGGGGDRRRRRRGGRRDAHVQPGAGGAGVEGVERLARGVNGSAVITHSDDGLFARCTFCLFGWRLI